MKDHILTALKEQFHAWETLLAGLSEAQRAAPLAPDSEWEVKDVLAHLWAWQQLSVARMEAAARGHEPVYPPWLVELGALGEEDVNRTNAGVFAEYHAQPWETVYALWRVGFLRLLNTGEAVPEPDLLSWSRFAWMDGPPVVVILLATYAHHQEHLEKVRAWVGGA